ncbi:hypothetical protein Ddc_00997 [Ditylenchus destructor]|nr:hypothetical protein Ddc_00997 [Ditylenchus destructor]
MSLDDGESLSDVRRITASRTAMSSTQSSFAAQISMLSGGRAGTGIPANINHTTTVRDVVSSRMRNKIGSGAHADSIIFSSFGASVNPSVNSWIKNSNISGNVNSVDGVNYIHTLMHENRVEQPAITQHSAKYVVTNLTTSSSLQQYPSPSTTPQNQQYLASTNMSTTKSAGSRSTTAIGIANLHHHRIGLTDAVLPPDSHFNNSLYPTAVKQIVTGTPTNAVSYLGNGSAKLYQNTAYLQTRTESPGKSVVMQRGTGARTPQAVMQAQQNRISPYPPDVKTQGASPSKSVGVGIAAANSTARGASPYAVVLPTHTRSEVIQNMVRESPSGTPHGGCTTPTGSQQQPNSHSSPRPSILRGSSAGRRLEKAEKESTASPAPATTSLDSASTTTLAVNFSTHSSMEVPIEGFSGIVAATTSGAVAVSSSSGEDYNVGGRPEDSPRKRQRKQQFDNSQQDKLMMEVKADPRFEQAPAENPGLWRQPSPATIQATAIQTGSVKSSGYQSASELNSGSTVLVNKVQKRRGRPRSTNRIDLSMVSAALSPGVIPSEQIAQSAIINQTPPLVQNSATNNVNAIPRSYMVDVDSMLQTNPLTKRPRKYKKRAPELDPNTGEPIKKPRKKGSGRKSKKLNELLSMETMSISNSYEQKGKDDFSRLQIAASYQQYCQPNLAANYSQQIAQPNVSVSIFSQLGLDERNVISTLCKLKSHRISDTHNGMKPCSSSTIPDDEIKQEPSRQSSVADEEEDEVRYTDKKEDQKEMLRESIKLLSLQKNTPLNATRFSELRPLWRLCDRSLESSLNSNYDEISAFLEACTPNMGTKQERYLTRHANLLSKFDADSPLVKCDRVECKLFDSYDQFENTRDAIRLLPAASAYYQSSNRLLDSLRLNLRSFSAYKLGCDAAKLQSPGLNDFAKNAAEHVSKMEVPPNADLIEKDHDELMQLFLHKLSAKNSRYNSAELSLLNEFSLLLDVCGVVDDMVDSVSSGCADGCVDEPKASSSTTSSQIYSDSSPKVQSQHLRSHKTVVAPDALSSFFVKLPHSCKTIFSTRRKYCEKLAGVHNTHRSHCRSKKQEMLSGGSDAEQNEPEDDSSARRLYESRRADFLMQTLNESNDRAQKKYKLMRKSAARVLSKLEPNRYEQCTKGTKQLSHHDVEVSFLMDLPKCKSSFKSVALYNTNVSLNLHPTKYDISKLFKGRHPYFCKRTQDSLSVVVDEPPPEPFVKPKLSAVDRLREKEATYLVLDELDEIVEKSIHSAESALRKLRLKYSNKKKEPIRDSSIQMEGSVSPIQGQSTTKDADRDYFTSSKSSNEKQPAKSPYPMRKTSQEMFYKEQCCETHELAATVFGLAHFRSNLARQCLESVQEWTKNECSNNNNAADSDHESRNGADLETDLIEDDDRSCSISLQADNIDDYQQNNSSDEDDPLGSRRSPMHSNHLKKRKWRAAKRILPNRVIKCSTIGDVGGRKFGKRTAVAVGWNKIT